MSAAVTTTDTDEDRTADSFQIWDKYEQVAMHFNDLIMRWRLQAIGGLAGVVTIAGFVVKDSDPTYRYRAMLLLSGALTLGWIGVAIIDLFYYRLLLQGAVEAIVAVEKSNPNIGLSTQIDEKAKWGAAVTPWLFYLFGLLPLAGFAIWAYTNLGSVTSVPQLRAAAPAVASRSTNDERLVQLQLSQACAESAAQFWRRFGYDRAPSKNETWSYANHYNRKLDKCLIAVRSTVVLPSGKSTTQQEVVDALEAGEPLGSLLRDSSGDVVVLVRANQRAIANADNLAWFRDLMTQ